VNLLLFSTNDCHSALQYFTHSLDWDFNYDLAVRKSTRGKLQTRRSIPTREAK